MQFARFVKNGTLFWHQVGQIKSYRGLDWWVPGFSFKKIKGKNVIPAEKASKMVETTNSRTCPGTSSLDSGHLDKQFGPLVF